MLLRSQITANVCVYGSCVVKQLILKINSTFGSEHNIALNNCLFIASVLYSRILFFYFIIENHLLRYYFRSADKLDNPLFFD